VSSDTTQVPDAVPDAEVPATPRPRRANPDQGKTTATYDANADDPKQHEMYLKYRALLEEEPEWHDGEIRSFP